jgi:chromosome segregation ATPase
MDERPLSPAMAQLRERVERLLLRHAELQRTNALLTERLQSSEAERSQLRQRLHDATQRIDNLLLRLDQTHSIPGTPDPHA